MFVRLLRVSVDAGGVDGLTGFLGSTLQPALERLEGSMGAALWTDGIAGDAVVASVWRNATALAASEDVEAHLREQLAGMTHGAQQVERYEAALVDARRPIRAGNVTRLLRISADPTDVYDHVAWAHDQVIPVLRGLPGYLSYFCGIDRSQGRAVVMTTYDDRTDADIALMTTSALHSAATDRGMTVEGEGLYDVAVAGIQISIPPIPTQRTVAVDQDEAVFWTPAQG